MRIALALLFIVLLNTNLMAQDLRNEVAACAIKSGDLERLQCYDNLAKKHNLDAPQKTVTKSNGIGKWKVSDSINPVDDSRTVVLNLVADSGKSSWGNQVYIVLRCQSNQTVLYINWNDYLGDSARVLSRVGRSTAVTKNWSISTDSKASFYPDSPIDFIRSMFEEDQLVAQITPYNESPVTAIFDIRGLQNAAEPLMETCGWNAVP